MKRRDRSEIVATILEVAQGGAKKTNILQKAYISFPQLTAYLFYLVEEKMIAYNISSRSYDTAEKGLCFLDAYHQMHPMMNPDDDDCHRLVGKPSTSMAV